MSKNPEIRYYVEETAYFTINGTLYEVARAQICDAEGSPLNEWSEWEAEIDCGYGEKIHVDWLKQCYTTREESIAACIKHAKVTETDS